MKVINLVRNKFRRFLIRLEEISGIDKCFSCRINRCIDCLGTISKSVEKGIRLFDLAQINLRDNGYYARLHYDSNMIIVFNSYFNYLRNDYIGTIAFKVGSDNFSFINKNANGKLVWTFKFSNNYYNDITIKDRPKILCEIVDPYCLDHILTKVSNHYKGI